MTDTNVIAITDNSIERVRQEVNQLLESDSVTQAAIHKESGLSRTTLSQFLNDKYPGDVATVAETLSSWLALRQQSRTVVTLPTFVETTTVKQIWSTLQYAQIAASIAIIYGNPGVSKTQALREYQRRNNNVWLVTISPSRASVMECLYEIALELGVPNPPRRQGPLSRLIAKKLEQTQGLLLIDEADQLSHEALEELRAIQERAEIGFALIGNHQVYSNLTGGKRNLDFARLFSRVGKKLVINKVKKSDVAEVARAWELTGNAERALMDQIAAKPGGLRTLFQTLKLAAMVARGKKQAITAGHIKMAFADLEGNEI